MKKIILLASIAGMFTVVSCGPSAEEAAAAAAAASVAADTATDAMHDTTFHTH